MKHQVLAPPVEENALLQLALARRHLTQSEIAKHLGVGTRTIRRWEARESAPPPYLVHALKELLPPELPLGAGSAFTFIDLFAGIGGFRIAFEAIGGACVFTSEWDSYAQRTYSENFRDGKLLAGDITEVNANDVPDHDFLRFVQSYRGKATASIRT
jgi:transcriptional regulator with XRE-family HTH domain